MEVKGWKYYNHAAVPTCAPHEDVDITPINNGQIWKINGGPFFARWITDYDCNEITSFWSCVLDRPFDLSELSAKRRYEVNKGNRNYFTRLVQPDEVEDMYDVYIESLRGYVEPIAVQSMQQFVHVWKKVLSEDDSVVIGAYERDGGRLCGYAQLRRIGRWIPMSWFKTRTSCEKRNVNFALMYGVCRYFEKDLSEGCYIDDGWRNVQHKTNFQDYLEKYFLFRKAHCRLNMRYKPGFGIIIKMLFPLRHQLKKLDRVSIMKKVNGVLVMEEMARNDKCR